MRVLKFGGTSVGSPERMMSLLDLIDVDQKSIVVLSAFSGVTNRLMKLSKYDSSKQNEKSNTQVQKLKQDYNIYAQELFQTESQLLKAESFIEEQMSSLVDYIEESKTSIEAHNLVITSGELVSTFFFQLLMEEREINSSLLFAIDFMSLNSMEEPDSAQISIALKKEISKNPTTNVFVTQGFVCKNIDGEVDNLKRGGSDYTATLIGAAVDAEEIQIWTDIDGMHNNDPRFVNGTKPITNLSYNEASELAYFGAKILHPSCVLPAMDSNIPVRLKNTMSPQSTGTLINNQSQQKEIKAIAAKDGITAIKIKSDRMLLAYGFLKKVFEVFEKHQTPIDMITTSEVAVSLTIDNDEKLSEIVDELNNYGAVEIDNELSIVCIVGDFIADHKGYGAQIFNCLREVPVRMISYGGSDNNVSVLVNSTYKKDALISLNNLLN